MTIFRRTALPALVFVFCACSFAHAQSPRDLLHAAAERYKAMLEGDSLEVQGHVSTEIPGTTWVYRSGVARAAMGRKFMAAESPLRLFDAFRMGGGVQIIDSTTNRPVPLEQAGSRVSGIGIPMSSAQFEQMEQGVSAVASRGTEILPFDGRIVSCEVLEVVYGS